jgi:hypothetical protein
MRGNRMNKYSSEIVTKGLSTSDLDFVYVQLEFYGYAKGDPIDLDDITTDILMFMESAQSTEKEFDQLRADIDPNSEEYEERLEEFTECEEDLRSHLRMVGILSKMYNNAMGSDGSDNTAMKFIKENYKG